MSDTYDFAQIFQSLSPDQQQQLLNGAGLGDAFANNDTTGQDTGGFGGSLNQMAFMGSQGGMPLQAQPDYGSDLGAMLSGGIPELTAKGKVDPVDLTQMAKRLNYTQDVGGSMFDVAQALFAGPSAWGDETMFQPKTTYSGTPIPARKLDDGTYAPVTASAQMLDDYTKNGGYEGFVADQIRLGKTPSQAIAAVRQLASVDPTSVKDKKQQQQILDIRNTLPVMYRTDPIDGTPKEVDRSTAKWTDFSEKDMLDFATGLYKDKTTSDLSTQTLNFDPSTGAFYPSMKTEESDAAKKFRNAGLPTPFERFDSPEYMQRAFNEVQPGYQQSDEQWGQQMQGLAKTNDDIFKAANQSDKNQADLAKIWAQVQPPTPDTQTQDRSWFKAPGSERRVGDKWVPNIPGSSPNGPIAPPLSPRSRLYSGNATDGMPSQTVPGSPGRPAPYVKYDAQGNVTGVITEQEAMARRLQAALGSAFNFATGKPQKGDPNAGLGRNGVGRLNQGDINNSQNRSRQTRQTATRLYNDRWKTEQQGAPGAHDRAYLAGQLAGQARSGVTPLQMAMQARLASLVQRMGL